MKKNILIINTVGYNFDGITSVILNYITAMDREGMSFSFAVYEDIPAELRHSLAMVGQLYVVPNRKRELPGYVSELRRILGRGYDVIHIHGNSGTMIIETVLAKFSEVKKIIVHAHSTSTDHPIINAVMKYPMRHMANTLLACSDAAGKWLYGNHGYTVLNNAIDLDRFRFREEDRQRYRREFGIRDDEFLIGHIGHFTAPKNHFFLIDMFAEFHRQIPDSRLLLIGDGADLEAVRKTAEQRMLSEAVIFAGQRADAAAIYSAMDLFVLPSRWEGLPLTMIEAQVNGLPLLVSDVITQDAQFTDRVYSKALSDGAPSWAQAMADIRSACYPRETDQTDAIRDKGFDICREADVLRTIYLS